MAASDPDSKGGIRDISEEVLLTLRDMATSEADRKGKNRDISEQILVILCEINEKLNQRDKDGGGVKVTSLPEDKLRWYRNSIADIHEAKRYISLLKKPQAKAPYEENPTSWTYHNVLDAFKYHPDTLVERYCDSSYLVCKSKSQERKNMTIQSAPRVASQMRETAGKFWLIPPDDRIHLASSIRSLGVEDFGSQSLDSREDNEVRALKEISELNDFDAILRGRGAAGFFVGDLDPWHDRFVIYEGLNKFETDINRETAGVYFRDLSWDFQGSDVDSFQRQMELKIDNKDNFAPIPLELTAGRHWRRIILLRGLGLMPMGSFPEFSFNAATVLDDATDHGIPYFQRHNLHWSVRMDQMYVNRLLKQHLLCSKGSDGGSFNPYLSLCGFHLAFFEILEREEKHEASEKTIWKTGQLFKEHARTGDTSQPETLRRSAFSIYVCYARDSVSKSNPISPLYTALVLAPEWYLSDPRDSVERLRRPIQHCTQIEAELFLIADGMSEIAGKWDSLDNYTAGLLTEDFMELESYNMLLFDDGDFTRSRKYFWLIGCLEEFIICIADNINQWDLYREARVQPLLEKPNLEDLLDAACLKRPRICSHNTWFREQRPEEFTKPMERQGPSDEDATFRAERLEKFKKLVEDAQKQRDRLKGLQTQFENKLERVKTLRDGLFNASALVETRASARLGQNVKLLTYVSIFYLPLAFCAALWAIPNIQEKSTKVPFVITAIIVGVVTYAMVLNMDSMATKLNTWYLPRRQNVLKRMHRDSRWQNIGERFEEFKPSSINIPTEWWIPLFVSRELLTKGTWIWKTEPKLNPSGNTQVKGIDPTLAQDTASKQEEISLRAPTSPEASAINKQTVPEETPKDVQSSSPKIFSRFKLDGKRHDSAV